MASNQEPSSSSYSKGKLRLKISSSTSSSPKQASMSPSTPPPPGVNKKTPPRRSFSLAPELKLYYDQVFSRQPQNPHFEPLEHFKSENMKEGIKLGFDVAFLNLVKKFQLFDHPTTYLREVDSLEKEFEEFEKVGYDLTLIKKRFNLLIAKAGEEKIGKHEVEELEEKEKEEEQKLVYQKRLADDYATELAEVQKEIEAHEEEIEKISEKKRKIVEDSNRNVHDFRALVGKEI